jgi:hypothetical protein
MSAATASVSPLSWLAERAAGLMPENVADLADETVDVRWGENRD